MKKLRLKKVHRTLLRTIHKNGSIDVRSARFYIDRPDKYIMSLYQAGLLRMTLEVVNGVEETLRLSLTDDGRHAAKMNPE